MAEFKVRTRGGAPAQGKARVYFVCHPADFDKYFDKICEDIFKTHDVAIYYTENMAEPLDETNITVDLGRMNLFVVPVTFRLMNDGCRAMGVDIAYAKEKNIAILPFMMESEIDAIYSLPKNFGERQYLSPFSSDTTEISYADKLKKYLDAVLISDEMAKRVRAAFDAYVFLSYRKKDRKHANELMKIIHNIPGCRDIAVWYDEFLTPGESFMENISRAMQNSKLFALLVTPNLLEEGNFVMREEYPAAKNAGMDILPTEMEKTDHNALKSRFIGIPEPVLASDVVFKETLLKTIEKIAKTENDGEPEHNFLIGLAYLNGIDVEKDADRGIELITMAADSGLAEAMEVLYNLYLAGAEVEYNIYKAQQWAKRLADHYTDRFGYEDARALLWMHNLSYTYHMSGKLREATELGETVLKLKIKLLGENHPDTLLIINNLAIIYRDLGEPKKAYEMLNRAYGIATRTLGEEHHNTLLYLSNLSNLLQIMGDYRNAIECSKKAYEVRARILGEENIKTIESLTDLGLCYLNLGDRVTACQIQEKVYTVYKKTFGVDNIKTAIAIEPLALSYYHLGSCEKARDIAEIGYNAALKNLGDGHPLSINYRNTLGLIYYGLGSYAKGKAILEEGRRLHENNIGITNQTYLNLLNNLGLCYYKLGLNSKAIELQEGLCKTQVESFGEDHPSTMLYKGNLAVYYGVAKRYDDQLRIERVLYEKKRQTLGENHPHTILSLYNQAAAYSSLRKYGQATELLEEVCRLRENNPNEKVRDKLDTLKLLASLYIATFKWAKAISVYKKIFKLYMS